MNIPPWLLSFLSSNYTFKVVNTHRFRYGFMEI